MALIRSAVILSFGLFIMLPVKSMSDHDSLVQLSQQTGYNTQRLDKHEDLLQKNAEKLSEIAGEVSTIRGIGIGVTAIGTLQVIIQLLGLIRTDKYRKQFNYPDERDGNR